MLERLNQAIPIQEKYNVAEIMQREQKAWGLKDIPPPPDGLFEVLNRANEKGYTTLEPHYFPERKFTQDSESSENHLIPAYNDDFLYFIRKGMLPTNAADLHEMWILIDTMEISRFIQIHPTEAQKDGLDPIIKQLKKENKIAGYNIGGPLQNYVEIKSRFGISRNQIYNVLNPAIAEMIQVPKKMCRLPRYIERRHIIVSLHHTKWPNMGNGEWLDDSIIQPQKNKKYDLKSARDLIENTEHHAFLQIDKNNFLTPQSGNNRNADVAFRPLIIFYL